MFTLGALGPLAAGAEGQLSPGRFTLSLDGEWEIGQSVSATDLPATFPSRVPVPGLVHVARPAFPAVDEFEGYELNCARILRNEIPASARIAAPGVSHQPRNYFWYRTTFRAPAQRATAILTIGRAQFGTAVWLNGRPLGEYPGCFTASRFVLTDAIRWNAENTLLVRIGAHPGVLPASYLAGSDFEKFRWTPGIYDRVSIAFSDNPVIVSVQVAPRLATSDIVVQTRVKNDSSAPCAFSLTQRAREWRTQRDVGQTLVGPRLELAPGEERTFTDTLPLPGAHLWSPDDPFLYELESSTGGDSQHTRFGMREFRSDAATGRFYLNGQPIWLRGSNIALHRFFEDPKSGALPWDEAWVQKLLGDIPAQLHWNAFRITIGPVPDRWLEIADERGLLIQNEFFVWTSHPKWRPNYARHWDAPELIREFTDWMRDGWNHPSVAIWDATNETFDPVFGEKVIPAVRPLDLSRRPWENSYNAPNAPDDPVEIHPYFYFNSAWEGRLNFTLADLEHQTATDIFSLGTPATLSEPHPLIVNEYGWLWLNRDGSPTALTQKLYPLILGPNATAAERLEFCAYLLAAETEFYRASRRYAGVMHFSYLTASYPGSYTSDSFQDIRHLRLDPAFADYMAEAFKPLGVCVEFFQATLPARRPHAFTIRVVNDSASAGDGNVIVTIETDKGEELARAARDFRVSTFGIADLEMDLQLPDYSGACVLRASAALRCSSGDSPTVSRRKFTLIR